MAPILEVHSNGHIVIFHTNSCQLLQSLNLVCVGRHKAHVADVHINYIRLP